MVDMLMHKFPLTICLCKVSLEIQEEVFEGLRVYNNVGQAATAKTVHGTKPVRIGGFKAKGRGIDILNTIKNFGVVSEKEIVRIEDLVDNVGHNVSEFVELTVVVPDRDVDVAEIFILIVKNAINGVEFLEDRLSQIIVFIVEDRDKFGILLDILTKVFVHRVKLNESFFIGFLTFLLVIIGCRFEAKGANSSYTLDYGGYPSFLNVMHLMVR